MRVPFEWLKDLVNITASADEVAMRLTMLGLEVEAVEHIDDDVVFEINVTPNRSDCLSVIGIARELSAAYGVKLKLPALDVVAETGELDFNVDILDTALCRRYAGRVVKNLRIGPSPGWLKQRLEKCGLRSINNVVDVTNYVLLELGQPLHAFDLKTIKGHRIRVGTPESIRGGNTAVEFKTLDGVEHRIPKDSLLIWDTKRPIAIAGIMGGLETEVSDTTKDIFIESAYFDPVSVRKTSKALGLKTESSYRFERGVDIKMLKKALDRAAYLMKEVAGGTIYGKIDLYPKKYAPADIHVRFEKMNRILGMKLSKKEVAACLAGLEFKVEETQDTFKVKPPAYRMDVKRDADVIEEVARTYGYERIPADLPRATVGIGGQGEAERFTRERIVRTLREAFLKSGYNEVVNYSFMGMQDLELLDIGSDDARRSPVQIKNPLRAEDAYMRTMLVPSLIRNVQYNISHGNRDLRLFEMSRVFHALPQEGESFRLPEERNHLAAAYYREKGKSLYKESVPDFFLLKGVFEAILSELKVRDCTFVRSAEPFLHPGQSADILAGGEKIGYMGVLSPVVVTRLDIKAHKMAFLVAEIDIDGLVPRTGQQVKYVPLQKYPYSERDTAIIVDSALEASTLVEWLKSYPSDLIEDISIFDVYQGGNIPEGKKSIAFNVRYRAAGRTLKDEEVDVLQHTLVEYILGKTNGQLRQ
ncbi:MAG TPA: phenylalanine--tRNA ligase subunit beta [Dissulfurispiraceae bacterium]